MNANSNMINNENMWILQIYQKFGLSDNPTLEEIDAKATEMLSDIKNLHDVIELIVGRRVDAIELMQVPVPLFQLMGSDIEVRLSILKKHLTSSGFIEG